MEFEWDREKAKKNDRKHKVSLESIPKLVDIAKRLPFA